MMMRVAAIAIVAACCGAAQDGSVGNPASLAAVQREKAPAQCLARMSEDFVPMTRSERAATAIASFTSPTPYFYTAIRAGINQGIDRPKEWGQGVEGYSLRYGSIYGEYFISQFFEQAVAYKLHEDNRYFGSGKRNVAARFAYAVSSALLARHDDRSRWPSISAIGGAATAAFVSRTWQPRSATTWGDGAVSFGLTIGTRMGINVLREFSPRLFGRWLP
jgi:hypothetical protein